MELLPLPQEQDNPYKEVPYQQSAIFQLPKAELFQHNSPENAIQVQNSTPQVAYPDSNNFKVCGSRER